MHRTENAQYRLGSNGSIGDLDMIHAEANKSGDGLELTPRVEKPGGHELVSFQRHEIRSITGPRINYELNATEAACDRKLSEPETNL